MIRFAVSVTVDIIATMLVLAPFFVEMGLGASILSFVVGITLYGVARTISKLLRKIGL
jgi:hypothetical protein